jgi:hypothetical protein
MATQVTLGSGVVDSASGLKLRTNGTTEAVDISTGQVATLAQNPILTSATASQALFTDSSKKVTSNAITGTGNVVMSASPTLTGTISAASLTTSGTVTHSGGTANGVAYLDGSKVLTTGSALTFDGTTLGINGGLVADANLIAQINSPAGGAKFFASNKAGAYGLLMGYDSSNDIARLRVIPNTALTFETNNAEQMRLTSTGLGIGTSSPASKLEVYGAFGTGTTGITLSNNSGYNASNLARFDFKLSNSFGGLEKVAAIWALNPNASANNGGALVFGTSANGTATTPTEGMRLDSSGNLGIGTSSPSVKLDVNGSGKFGGSYVSFGDNGYIRTDAANVLRFQPGSGGYEFAAQGNGSVLMSLNSSGNLGLGVTPSAWNTSVRAFETATGAFYSYASGSVSNFYMLSNAYLNSGGNPTYKQSAAAAQYLQSAGQHIFYNAASGTAGTTISFTQAMTLDASGSLLLGTAGLPQNNGKLAVAAASGLTARFYNTESLAQFSGAFDKSQNDNTSSQSYVAFTYNAQGSGAGKIVGATSTVAFAAYSDRRLKENIVPLENQLQEIMKLKPSEFDYIDGRGHTVGFIAQEVQEVFPEMVASDDDEMGTLYIAGLSPFEARLVKAIQEQQAIINSLKARLDAANL